MVALARCGDKSLEPRIVAALDRLPWATLSESERLDLLRAYGLTFARMGKPSAEMAAPVIAKLDSLFPAKQAELNRELSAQLVYLEAPGAVSRTLKLLETSPVQEEQIWCAYVLRTATSGWTFARRAKGLFRLVPSGDGVERGP